MRNGVQYLPADPTTVALYITDLFNHGKKVSTIQRRLFTISQRHQSKGFETPVNHSYVKNTWHGIRKTLGVREHGKAPLVLDDIRRLVRAQSLRTKSVIRNRALFLIGFVGAFRRSELVALNVEDLEFRDDGLIITVTRSKTDQEGRGMYKWFPFGSDRDTCPIRSLQRWLKVANITTGPIFRPINKGDQIILKREVEKDKWVDARLSGHGVACIVKKCAKRVGYDSTLYAGHSLRSGFATTADRSGVDEQEIMDQTGHRSRVTLQRYIRKEKIARNNAASKIGL